MVDRIKQTSNPKIIGIRETNTQNPLDRCQRERYTCPVDSYTERRYVIPPIGEYYPEKVPIGEIPELPDSVVYNPVYNAANFYFRHISLKYKVVDNKGVSYAGARDIDICLAKYSQKVAETMDISDTCYTGVKYALLSAGVISDYGDMPKGSAYKAKEYFDAHPDKFQKLTVSRNELKNLPAGVIIVYSKAGKNGHIAITNGKGQEMSDSTDNMGWLDEHGKGATFTAYKLTDNWQYNRETMKLEFHTS